MKRIPAKADFLKFYKEHGSEIKTVIDVGVQKQTHEIKDVYRDCKQVLVEPAIQFRDDILFNYENLKDVVYVWKAASNEVGSCYLHLFSIKGDGKPTHSAINDNPNMEKNDLKVIEVEKIRIDELVKTNNYPSPYLLKVDVDGHDLEVLRGAEGILANTDVVIVEAPLHFLSERLNYLESQGFVLWDIVDLCYFRGKCWQVDLVLINKTIFENVDKYPEINPLKHGFPIASNYQQLKF